MFPIVPAARAGILDLIQVFEPSYLNLAHYNRLPKGGHFAAWEQPQLLTAELRATLQSLR